jgi:hypothetical protein
MLPSGQVLEARPEEFSLAISCSIARLLLAEPGWRHLSGYHHARTHLSLTKDAPDGRPVERPELGKVVPIREMGGLHHRRAT